MHTLFDTTSIYEITSIYTYMDYCIANRWEVAEAVLGISPTWMRYREIETKKGVNGETD